MGSSEKPTGFRTGFYQPDFISSGLSFVSSSNKIRMDGVTSSSYCPDLTDHKNTSKKLPAMTSPTNIKTYIALIIDYFSFLKEISRSEEHTSELQSRENL